jgi:glycosyltransferase involved in cell wall biosynthesis
MRPQIDVVVVTYASAEHLEPCLRALPDWCSVVVVDNASPDDSADIAERCGARVVRNPDNRGFAAAANQGVALGSNELVLLLNPDAVVDERSLCALVDALVADPSCAVVGPRLRRPDGSEQRPIWPFPTSRAAWLEALGLLRIADRRPDGFVIGACFLTRRSIWNELDELDERYWLYGEEADYCKRATLAGHTVRLVESAEARHIGGASGPALGARTFEHFHRGTEHFIVKFEGPQALGSYRRALLVGSLLRWPILRIFRPNDERTGYRIRVILRELSVLRNYAHAVHSVPDGIVALSLEAWDDVWRRNQFLVRDLVGMWPDRRILWVEPPHDVLHSVRSGGPFAWNRGLRPVPEMAHVHRVQPVKWLPRSIDPWADRRLARQVQRAARRLGLVRPTLWVNDPSYARLVERTGWPALYDMTDDWVLAAQGAERERIIANERILFDRCGKVVVCSPGLQASREDRRPVTLIPNAVDADHFRTPRPRPHDLPPGPVAVYVGTLHDLRIDVPLLDDLATSMPELAIVLVGPNVLRPETNAALGAHPHVHLLGSRPYADVPAYLQHADVLIVPHAVNDFTESLDPIKAYELLAVDRPVVATPIAGFRELAGAFTVADRHEFVAAVQRALDEPSEVTQARPEPPSWLERTVAFSAALDQCRYARRLRVAYVGHTARVSGGELALARLLPALYDVDRHVILAEPGPMVERYEACGATVEVLPMAEGARGVKKDTVAPRSLPLGAVRDTVRYVLRLRRRLRELQPDIVHTNTLKAAIYGGIAGRLAGVPVVWHVRDRIADDYLPGPAVRAVRGLAKLLPSAVISNSNTTMGTLGRLRGVRRTVPSPVVFDCVDDVPAAHQTDGPFERVGMVGRIAPWKGQDVFLRAFALAFPSGEVRAVLVGAPLFGEDAYEQSLHDLVAELGIAERVEFRGFRDDVPAELARLDVLVHASITAEPFGQVVVEGMAAGLPVIASAEGGPAEVITDGVDGLLVPPGQPKRLADALRRVAADPGLRRRLGERAQRTAAAYTPENVATQVLEVYQGVLERR